MNEDEDRVYVQILAIYKCKCSIGMVTILETFDVTLFRPDLFNCSVHANWCGQTSVGRGKKKPVLVSNSNVTLMSEPEGEKMLKH